jgi:hypothetical protein
MMSTSRFASTAAHVTPGYRLGSGGNEERFGRCSSASADMDWRPTAAGADDAHSRAALPRLAGPVHELTADCKRRSWRAV